MLRCSPERHIFCRFLQDSASAADDTPSSDRVACKHEVIEASKSTDRELREKVSYYRNLVTTHEKVSY